MIIRTIGEHLFLAHLLEDKFDQPAGDAAALISSDRLKVEEVLWLLGNLTFDEARQHSVLDFSDDFLQCATLANIAVVIPCANTCVSYAVRIFLTTYAKLIMLCFQ